LIFSDFTCFETSKKQVLVVSLLTSKTRQAMKPLQNLKNLVKVLGSERLNKSSEKLNLKSSRLNINDFKEQEDFFLFI
jgi:hypothetical protein